ncbi:MAG TPA: hypothetical protein VHZ95_20885 [Polyangiales bacterium]|jgi:hypothetical protein|nr:hypothetical protein [Polyangiales bacterium]
MLRRCALLSVVLFAQLASVRMVSAQHELPYEFRGTRVAVSIERFMGIDYTDFAGPGRSDVSARLFLNASEPVPTSLGRFGIDVFIERVSVGLAGGVTDKNVGIIAPRVGYLFGLTPTIGLWLRGGGFYASAGPHYLGLYAEALLGWFPYPHFALHLGPTLDLAFANKPNPNYTAIGLPEFGMTAWF